MLVDAGIDLNSFDLSKMTPLHYAAQVDSRDMIEFLIDSGKASVDVPSENQKYTALHIAAINGSKNAVQTLLERNANLHAADFKKRTALDLATMALNLSLTPKKSDSGEEVGKEARGGEVKQAFDETVQLLKQAEQKSLEQKASVDAASELK